MNATAKVAKPLPRVGTSVDGRPKHYSVGAIVRDEQNRILLMDRKYEPHGFAGMAGHVDQGEYALQALMREGREELGTTLRHVRPICAEEVLWNYCGNDGVHRTEVHDWSLYSAHVSSRDVKVTKREAKRWDWFTEEDIRRGWYVKGRREYPLVLEKVWQHWFKKVGIIRL